MASTSGRTGYTLLELILVMAILVMVGAVAYPSIDSVYGYYKQTAAVDAIKGAWAQARARAIEDGIPYRFGVILDGSKYRVAPDQAEYWTGTNPDPPDPEHPPLILENTLPKDVRFAFSNSPNNGGNGNGTEPDNWSGSNTASIDSGAWSTVVVFEPIGSASDDVDLTFNVKGVNPATLRLRALTGTVKVVSKKQEGR